MVAYDVEQPLEEYVLEMATFTEPMTEDLENKEPEVAVTVAKVEEPAPAADGNPTEMTRFVGKQREGGGRYNPSRALVFFSVCLFLPVMGYSGIIVLTRARIMGISFRVCTAVLCRGYL